MKADEVVHKIADLYDNAADEQGAINLLEQYTNQRVIEELKIITEDNLGQSTPNYFNTVGRKAKVRLYQLTNKKQ